MRHAIFADVQHRHGRPGEVAHQHVRPCRIRAKGRHAACILRRDDGKPLARGRDVALRDLLRQRRHGQQQHRRQHHHKSSHRVASFLPLPPSAGRCASGLLSCRRHEERKSCRLFHLCPAFPCPGLIDGAQKGFVRGNLAFFAGLPHEAAPLRTQKAGRARFRFRTAPSCDVSQRSPHDALTQFPIAQKERPAPLRTAHGHDSIGKPAPGLPLKPSRRPFQTSRCSGPGSPAPAAPDRPRARSARR